MRLGWGLVLLAALSACGTPQERCIGRVTREYRTLDALRGSVQENLDRGYALEDYQVTETEWVRCEDEVIYVQTTTPEGQVVNLPQHVPSRRMCMEDVTHTYTRRVPIDPGAEKRKLKGLEAKMSEQRRTVDRAIASCKIQYPE